MAECTIGVDIGSTSVKAVLYDVAADKILHVASAPLSKPIENLPEGFYEDNPIAIRNLTIELLKSIAQIAVELHCSATRICFTGQMHGGLFVDAQLNPTSNFITWQDKRGDTITNGQTLIENLRTKLPESAWLETGGNVHTGFLGVTANWFIQNGGLPQKSVKLLGIYEWIAGSLCGNICYTDPSSAAAWGLYSIKEKNWSSKMLSALEIPDQLLPTVIECGDEVGELTPAALELLGYTGRVVIISGMGDTQASYIGSGCEPNQLLLNFGTGSQGMFEASRFCNLPGTDIRYLPKDRYLITIPTLSGGKSFATLEEFFAKTLVAFGGQGLQKDEMYARMVQLAMASAVEAQSVEFTPFFNGNRFLPEGGFATISGLNSGNFNPSALISALLAGMVREISEPYFRLPTQVRTQERLLGSGNGLKRNAALEAIASRIFGMELDLSPFDEEAARGAARLAAGLF
jgi:sedoheptulokinase